MRADRAFFSSAVLLVGKEQGGDCSPEGLSSSQSKSQAPDKTRGAEQHAELSTDSARDGSAQLLELLLPSAHPAL